MDNKLKGPIKGSFEKLTNRLKELGSRPPPQSLMEILNRTEETKPNGEKKIAASSDRSSELDV